MNQTWTDLRGSVRKNEIDRIGCCKMTGEWEMEDAATTLMVRRSGGFVFGGVVGLMEIFRQKADKKMKKKRVGERHYCSPATIAKNNGETVRLRENMSGGRPAFGLLV
ncbi:hypothetical protein HAX54_039528 [Datura stramonium]|uniref:Uncharacterized protein n=1 Tax=Datura stramonium TaxID=4076 RepID=A0ABS8VPK7_DATST|nr:hypothetical protein [Datura stramonium]